MSGGKRAKREAEEAARQADQQRSELEKQRQELKRKKELESKKAQRLLFRSLRAGGGGFFESDTDAPSNLGGGNGGALG